MGETKKAEQDVSLQKETPSAGEPGTTSKETAKTYTEEETQKAVSDALAKAGRDAKSLAAREATINTQQAEVDTAKGEITELQKQIDEAELEAARGDPEKLRELQAKKSYKAKLTELQGRERALQKQQDELNRSKAEHEAEIEAARGTQMEIEIWRIAAAEGVDPVELKDTMKDLSLTTVEQAKGLAKRLAKPPQAEPTGEKWSPDSGVTSGGTNVPQSAKGKIRAGWDELHKK